ncbi:MAG: hypothetical protein HC771_11910 [Synechococcales cyanobacterium CRU_2_2]|nr:hypothetical protein [Synechococcales cyanobacterium CRU_2_2]
MSDSSMPPERTPERTPEQQAQRQRLQRIYLTLILSSLAVGGVLAFILVLVLRHFGLTQSPGS